MNTMSPPVRDLLRSCRDDMAEVAARYRNRTHGDSFAVLLLDLGDPVAFAMAEGIGKGNDQTPAVSEKVLETLRLFRHQDRPLIMAMPIEMARAWTFCGSNPPGTFLAVVVAEGGCWNRAIPLYQAPAKP